MKKVIQLFVAFFAIMFVVQVAWNNNLDTALLISLAFATVMSAFLGFLHIQSGSHEPVQEALWDVPLGYDEAFRQCKEAGRRLKKAEIKEERGRDGIIKVRTGASWKSWGDEVVFQLQEIDARTTRVAVTSRPKLKAAYMDYGKNYENVRTIGRQLGRDT